MNRGNFLGERKGCYVFSCVEENGSSSDLLFNGQIYNVHSDSVWLNCLQNT